MKVWIVINEIGVGNAYQAFSTLDAAKARLVEIGDNREEFTSFCMELEIDGPAKCDGAVDYTLRSIQQGGGPDVEG